MQSPREARETERLVSNGVNQLLACLPPTEARALFSELEPVELRFRSVLHARDEPIRHVYFPETAVCSIVAVMASGDAAESGTVGRDGFIGVPVALGVDSVPFDTIVQVPGRALRMPAARFRELLDTSPGLRVLVERHVEALLVQSLQSTACNRLHSLTQRSCRWLLLTHDRVGGTGFRLTHDLLAVMVGVRRPSVSAVVQQLERKGFLTYSRGWFAVEDRKGLEQQSCECYRVIQDHLARLFPRMDVQASASRQT